MDAVIDQSTPRSALASRFSPGKYLCFCLGDELYAIPVGQVLEILRVQAVTPIPNRPPYVKGVMNLRGKVIPVVDMRLKFKLGEDKVDERTCIIVVEVTQDEDTVSSAGLVVDCVEEVVFIAQEAIESDPGLGTSSTTQHIQALTKIQGRLTSLLDLDRVVVEEVFNLSTHS